MLKHHFLKSGTLTEQTLWNDQTSGPPRPNQELILSSFSAAFIQEMVALPEGTVKPQRPISSDCSPTEIHLHPIIDCRVLGAVLSTEKLSVSCPCLEIIHFWILKENSACVGFNVVSRQRINTEGNRGHSAPDSVTSSATLFQKGPGLPVWLLWLSACLPHWLKDTRQNEKKNKEGFGWIKHWIFWELNSSTFYCLKPQTNISPLIQNVCD